MTDLQLPPDHFNAPQEEEAILAHWRKIDVFKKQLELTAGKPHFTFYDGPPFATGLPHYGHILAGTIKDIVCRYASMTGHHVDRRFGWDCHGLPVEYEIEKTNNITGPDDVQRMGLRAYCDLCRAIVSKYSKEWEIQVMRLGRWIDFERDYKTMYPWFMESVWWVFQQLWNKNEVYAGHKVMPYSTKCNTPLSNFEAQQNYQMVDDPAVVVSFKLEDDTHTHLLAWTTTPWTLPSNLALCVNANEVYVKVKDAKTGHMYVLMEKRLVIIYKKEDEYEILDHFAGSTLVGRHYTPLLPFFAHMRTERSAFRVVADDYVTVDVGTGIVHQAPYFGEDDMRVCERERIIEKGMKPVCPVDASGRFTSEVPPFAGVHVKEADAAIIKHLKANEQLVWHGRCVHSYPFCWRSDTPLIYKAVPSFFVRVEKHRDELLANMEQTQWVPTAIRDGRFRNWLRDARDWCIGRNRYWGTPIPLWTNELRTEWVCVGSIEELRRLSGRTDITDLHRDYIDDVTIPSSTPGAPPLRRVCEVFDCWFESGSMPYAQAHFPFENEANFRRHFPAEFIAEGIDQTRGWFYTLLVLSTLLFNKPPFKNLIVNGLVLAGDGQKMSKSKKNYPDPMNVVNKYGADAVRLYLINSPVVRGENLRFKEEGVNDILKDVQLPWYNAYRFLVQNIVRYRIDTGEDFVPVSMNTMTMVDMMDKWIVSAVNSLVQNVRVEMAAYRLYTVVPLLLRFIDTLTNWYVRMNRRRLKCETGVTRTQCEHALHTLYYVLDTVARLMAPFAPYQSELIYTQLSRLLPPDQRRASVHHTDVPTADVLLIDATVERRVTAMRTVVDIARVLRDQHGVGLKYPLAELVCINNDPIFLADVQAMVNYICEEVNVRTVSVTDDKQRWGVQLRADLNYKALGQRLKKDMQAVANKVKQMGDVELSAFIVDKHMTVCGYELAEDDVLVKYVLAGQQSANGERKYEAHADGAVICVLDMTEDTAMHDEGLSREIINRMQKQRKAAKLNVSDECEVYVHIEPSDSCLWRVLTAFKSDIELATKQTIVVSTSPVAGSRVLDTAKSDVKNFGVLHLILVDRRTTPAATVGGSGAASVDANSIHVVYAERPRLALAVQSSMTAKRMSVPQLYREVRASFNLHATVFDLVDEHNGHVLGHNDAVAGGKVVRVKVI